MPTNAFKGRLALLKVSSDGGSTYATIGGVKTTGAAINNEPVDITNAGSGGWKEWLADGGVQSVSMNVDGGINDAEAFQTMMTQAADRTKVRYKMEFAGTGIISGEFVITTFNINGAFNDAQAFSASLESSGVCTVDPPT